jgi:hypothetical protein
MRYTLKTAAVLSSETLVLDLESTLQYSSSLNLDIFVYTQV